jgi:hypothetical protein
MTKSVLGTIILGYKPLWNRQRDISGVQLFIEVDPVHPVDARHLLRTLEELWTPHSPPLLLSPHTPQLLHDLLEHAPPQAPWIEVKSEWLSDIATLQAVFSAHERGLFLVWRGNSAQLPDPEVAACFEKCLLTLTPEDALQALRDSVQALTSDTLQADGPVLRDQLYESIASRTLMRHCLDQRGAQALVGWPSDDVLHSYRHQGIAASNEIVTKLIRVVKADESMEVIEQIMSQDPVLVYRFLAHANSPTLGLQSGIDSLRRALMMIGYTSLGVWLQQQLPATLDDIDLKPIKAAIVLRAHLMEMLLDAGEEHELQREVYLCGLFSQLDALLDEPLGTAVQTLPLSERIFEATVAHTGPYEPCLALATAMECEDTIQTRLLCEQHEMDIEEVNRVLLRTLASLYVAPVSGEFGERRRRSRARTFGS